MIRLRRPVRAQVPLQPPITPWAHLGAACRGGFSRWGLHLMAGWFGFALATSTLWAFHLRRLTGWSALPNYWGETLTARDLWELLQNGGLKHHWSGPWVPLCGGAALLWFLWSGWRLQAAAAGLPARLGPWVWGLVDALVLGAVPLAVLGGLVRGLLVLLGGTGWTPFHWLEWVGDAVLPLVVLAGLFLQWWLCRLGRAAAPPGFRLGSWRRLGQHLELSFRRFWCRPGQWWSVILGGVALRSGLTLLVLALAWRLGGASILKVWAILALQLLVVLANAWQLGWFLRLTGLAVRPPAED